MENENNVAEKEQQSIDKHNAELKEQTARQEERQREQERAETDRRNAERLQRESEQRRKEERERTEHLKQVEEHRKQREKELANRQVGGGDNKELESHLAKGRQLDIQANKEGRGAKQEQSYKSLEERQINIDYRYAMEHLKEYLDTVQKYENLQKNVEQLDKVNKSLESTKDKKAVEKYQTTKESLEKKICDTLEIKKDKPKFLQSKKAVESSFKDKVKKGLADLGAKAEVAKAEITKIKAVEKAQTTHGEYKPANRTASRTVKPQTRARGR